MAGGSSCLTGGGVNVNLDVLAALAGVVAKDHVGIDRFPAQAAQPLLASNDHVGVAGLSNRNPLP